jgi:hypothetical protein
MVIFGIDPAGARQTAAQIGQYAADVGRYLQPGEQTRHRKILDAEARFRKSAKIELRNHFGGESPYPLLS